MWNELCKGLCKGLIFRGVVRPLAWAHRCGRVGPYGPMRVRHPPGPVRKHAIFTHTHLMYQSTEFAHCCCCLPWDGLCKGCVVVVEGCAMGCAGGLCKRLIRPRWDLVVSIWDPLSLIWLLVGPTCTLCCSIGPYLGPIGTYRLPFGTYWALIGPY